MLNRDIEAESLLGVENGPELTDVWSGTGYKKQQ